MFNIHKRLFFSPDETEGSTLEIPEPKTRTEKFLAKMAGVEIDIEPKTRIEKFLAKMAGDEIVIEPKTRREKFMNAISVGGGEGSSGEPSEAYDAQEFIIELAPFDQWIDHSQGGPAWYYYPSGLDSYYDQYGKRKEDTRGASTSFPCTAYLQKANSYQSNNISGIIAVLFNTGSLTVSNLSAAASRGTVTLIQVKNNLVAIYWYGIKNSDPVTITISEA